MGRLPADDLRPRRTGARLGAARGAIGSRLGGFEHLIIHQRRDHPAGLGGVRHVHTGALRSCNHSGRAVSMCAHPRGQLLACGPLYRTRSGPAVSNSTPRAFTIVGGSGFRVQGSASVDHSKQQRLAHVIRPDVAGACEVGDRARHLPDAVVGARAENHPGDRRVQQAGRP
jgi:hypothetical protein